MQQAWTLDRSTHPDGTRTAAHGAPRLLNLPKALAAMAVSLVRRRRLRTEAGIPPPLAGFVRGEAVRLPKGELISAEEVELRHSEFGQEAVATGSEAWIAVRVGRTAIWYAMWYDDQQRWELLGV